MVKNTSLCGLGQTAPNPVLSTLRYFRTSTWRTSTRSDARRESVTVRPAATEVNA